MMRTILYFNGEYIDSLDGLRKLFHGNIGDNLRRDLLASFQDGALGQWLGEGDGECLRVLEQLNGIATSLSNQMMMERLKQVFTNENAPSCQSSSKLKFEDHCQIEQIKYCKLDSDGSPIGQPEKAKSIRFKKGEHLGFELFFSIKVTNPDNEILSLELNVSDRETSKYKETIQLPINTRKNDVKNFSVKVNLNEFSHNIHKATLSYNDKTLWKTSVIMGSQFLRLKIDSQKIPFTYVEGSGDIKSFYMMRYVAINSESDRSASTYVSYNDIQSYIRMLQNEYKITLRLPTVKEWQYAAKGGIHNESTLYAGSDDINKVAWYSGNSMFNLQRVGKKAPNKLGLYDMSGNVWEMTEDTRDTYRVICGGSIDEPANECTVGSTSMIGCAHETRHNVGFRLVCDIEEMERIDEKYIEFNDK